MKSKPRQRYSAEFKAQAVELISTGRPISQIAEERVQNVEDFLKVGDRLQVKIAGIDNRGKLDLIRPELEGKIAPRAPRSGPPRGDRPDGDRNRDRGPRRF